MYLFVTNIFVFFILVLLKKFKFDIVLAKKRGKNVALLNPPQLQSLQNKSLKKKCCETTFFSLLSCILYFKFPTLALPP